jgi:hypothetical protein
LASILLLAVPPARSFSPNSLERNPGTLVRILPDNWLLSFCTARVCRKAALVCVLLFTGGFAFFLIDTRAGRLVEAAWFGPIPTCSQLLRMVTHRYRLKHWPVFFCSLYEPQQALPCGSQLNASSRPSSLLDPPQSDFSRFPQTHPSRRLSSTHSNTAIRIEFHAFVWTSYESCRICANTEKPNLAS